MEQQLHQQVFECSPFAENTYILYDDAGQAVLIDPGCYDLHERNMVQDYVLEHHLTVSAILNTHGHLDHVFGNAWARRTFGVPVFGHRDDDPILLGAERSAAAYGVHLEPPGMPDRFIAHGDLLQFGALAFQVLHVPGHCPGHVAFYHAGSGQVWSGDVLFRNSIGRYDFPLSNYHQLMHSITKVLAALPDSTIVWPGHGPSTILGHELRSNPFILEYVTGQ